VLRAIKTCFSLARLFPDTSQKTQMANIIQILVWGRVRVGWRWVKNGVEVNGFRVGDGTEVEYGVGDAVGDGSQNWGWS
jgi:hypothetical protein